MSVKIGRREALRFLGAAAMVPAAYPQNPATKFATKPVGDPLKGIKLGITSYTTRELTLKQTLTALQSLGIKYIALKDFHLSMTSTQQERAAVVKRIRAAGITILGAGVITLRNDEAHMRQCFEYVRDIGAPTAVVALDPPAVPTLDKAIKGFDLRVAIHNHGPEDTKFPSPLDVWSAIQGLDNKIGLCIDVGHTFRTGVDPAMAIRKCASRLYDVHIKDLSGPETPARNVAVGTGVLDVVGILKALVEIKYPHHLALEYEADADTPVPNMAESLGYIRGALAAL